MRGAQPQGSHGRSGVLASSFATRIMAMPSAGIFTAISPNVPRLAQGIPEYEFIELSSRNQLLRALRPNSRRRRRWRRNDSAALAGGLPAAACLNGYARVCLTQGNRDNESKPGWSEHGTNDALSTLTPLSVRRGSPHRGTGERAGTAIEECRRDR